MPVYDSVSEKSNVVLDLGTAYTKCGFAGEVVPRCIIPSQIKRKTGKLFRLSENVSEEELYDGLVTFIHHIYFRELLINPKERKVIIAESIFATTKLRCTLAKVLFKHFEVPSLLFASSHTLTLLTLRLETAMVVDAGYAYTVVLPVYLSTPIMKAAQILPIAAKAIHEHLEAQLLEQAMVITEDRKEANLSAVQNVMSETDLEDIKIKTCFVTRMDRAEIHRSARIDDEVDKPTPPPSVNYPLNGRIILKVPGSIRESTCEILFGRDDDCLSIANMILESLLKCPIDSTKKLSSNIILCGGTSMLPGFKPRLVAELKSLAESDNYKNRIFCNDFKIHQTPSKENYTSWLGGAIFSSLDQMVKIRSITREHYLSLGTNIPDWCSLNRSQIYCNESVDEKLSTVVKDSTIGLGGLVKFERNS